MAKVESHTRTTKSGKKTKVRQHSRKGKKYDRKKDPKAYLGLVGALALTGGITAATIKRERDLNKKVNNAWKASEQVKARLRRRTHLRGQQ